MWNIPKFAQSKTFCTYGLMKSSSEQLFPSEFVSLVFFFLTLWRKYFIYNRTLMQEYRRIDLHLIIFFLMSK